MSVVYRDSDIFKAKELCAIAHQANCFNLFGAGVAKQLADKFPRIVDDDKCFGSPSFKVGKYSVSTVYPISYEQPNLIHIINLYGQYHPGKNTNYKYLNEALRGLNSWLNFHALNYVVGIPYGIGCGIGGGDWGTVEAMIKEIFDNSLYTIMICRLPNAS